MTPDIKRILVPLDFSANSARALDYARGLALKFDAALHPAAVDYLYFVSRNDGSHVFSKTYDEHSRRVAEFQGRR